MALFFFGGTNSTGFRRELRSVKAVLASRIVEEFFQTHKGIVMAINVRTVFVIFTLACFGMPLSGADVVWVHQSRGNHLGSWDDDEWKELLESNGHDIIAHAPFDNIDVVLEDLETLNSGDIVIFSRDSNSGDYNNSEEEVLFWTAGIADPMIVMTPYVLRSSRWLMVDSTTIGDALEPMEAIDTTHPIFDGIPLDGNNQVEIWDDQIFGPDDNIDIIQASTVGNGEVIAIESGTEFPWIIHWEPGVEFYDGSGSIAGGPRLFYSAGSDDDPNTWGGKNTTPAGDQVLLNAIDWLVGPDTPPGDFDGNGTFDTGDIDELVAQVAMGGTDPLFDMNGDSSVDTLDIEEWLSVAATQNGFASPYLPGDANLSGNVDAADLNALGVSWQQDLALWSAGDFTANGSVGADDLNVLGLNWQESIAAAAAVPEPASLSL